jgi:hypothetical protein
MDGAVMDDAEALVVERRRNAEERHEAIMAAIHGIHTRLDVLNGRTRACENDLLLMKDRQVRFSAVAGSILTALAAALAYAVTLAAR